MIVFNKLVQHFNCPQCCRSQMSVYLMIVSSTPSSWNTPAARFVRNIGTSDGEQMYVTVNGSGCTRCKHAVSMAYIQQTRVTCDETDTARCTQTASPLPRLLSVFLFSFFLFFSFFQKAGCVLRSLLCGVIIASEEILVSTGVRSCTALIPWTNPTV